MSYSIKFGRQYVSQVDPNFDGVFFRLCEHKTYSHSFGNINDAIRTAQALGNWDIKYELGNFQKTFYIQVLDESGECVYKQRGLKTYIENTTHLFTQDW